MTTPNKKALYIGNERPSVGVTSSRTNTYWRVYAPDASWLGYYLIHATIYLLFSEHQAITRTNAD